MVSALSWKTTVQVFNKGSMLLNNSNFSQGVVAYKRVTYGMNYGRPIYIYIYIYNLYCIVLMEWSLLSQCTATFSNLLCAPELNTRI